MDFQGGMIVLIVFVSLFCDLAPLLFYSGGTVVLGPGVGRAYQPAATGADALAQGPALDHRFVDDREHESRTDPQSQRAGPTTSRAATSRTWCTRWFRPRKANIMLDFKMATAIDLAGRDVFEAVQMSVNPCDPTHASRGRRGQGRHPADRKGPRHGARQHQAAGRRRRRGDRAGACRRGHRFVDRLGCVA